MFSKIIAFSLTLGLLACQVVPSSGPNTAEMREPSDKNQDIIVIEITNAIANQHGKRGYPSLNGSFGDRNISREPVITIGDSIGVTLWEAGGGGLFGQGQSVNGSRSTLIPDQLVASDGAISVPYAGRIKVVGKTPRVIEATLVESLEGKAIQPQALVTIVKSTNSQASILLADGGGGRIPLSLKGDRLLDVIAQAGGIKTPIHETFVTLNRGAKTLRLPLQTVLMQSRENIYIRPNDTITLTREPHTFTAAGASAKNAQIPFDAIGITLEEAIAKAGGLLDQRSDPSGVFLLRFEEKQFVKILKPESDLSRYQNLVPVIYHLKLNEAAGFFLSRQFPVRNKDILYVSNAPMSDLQKVFTLFNLLITPAARLQ